MTFQFSLGDARILKDALVRTLVDTGIWHNMDDQEDRHNILSFMMHVANTPDEPLQVITPHVVEEGYQIKIEPTDEERNARKTLPSKAKAKVTVVKKEPTPRKTRVAAPKKVKEEPRASSAASTIELTDAEKAALATIGSAKRKIIVAE